MRPPSCTWYGGELRSFPAQAILGIIYQTTDKHGLTQIKDWQFVYT